MLLCEEGWPMQHEESEACCSPGLRCALGLLNVWSTVLSMHHTSNQVFGGMSGEAGEDLERKATAASVATTTGDCMLLW